MESTNQTKNILSVNSDVKLNYWRKLETSRENFFWLNRKTILKRLRGVYTGKNKELKNAMMYIK